MSDCLFCKIAKGELKAEVVLENEEAMAVLDIHPRAGGHVFVIPKDHFENLLDAKDEKLEGIFKMVKEASKKVKEATGAEALTIGINNGRVSGQEIDHLHIHIIPRFSGDGGGSIQSVVNNVPSEEEREEIKKKLIK